MMEIAARIGWHRSLLAAIALIGIITGVWLRQPTARAQTDVHLFAVASKDTFLDFERPGLRLGDRVAARARLLDPAQTDQVGRAFLDCVVVKRITDDPVGGLY
jgi:hypothetical protein